MSGEPELDHIAVTGTYREDYGKSHRYYIDGVRVPGCTTLINAGVPKPLAKYGAETVANFTIDNWSRLARLPVSQRLKEMTGSVWADVDRSGIRGTQVHQYAEWLLRGDPVPPVNEKFAGYVKACRQFLEDRDVKPVLVEEPCFSRRYGYGATMDLLARLKDEKLWLLDWKTNRSGPWGEVSLQLSSIQFADFYLSDDGTETPMPQADAYGAVWLKPDGTYELYPYHVDKKVFRQFLAVKQVAEAVDDMKAYKGDPL